MAAGVLLLSHAGIGAELATAARSTLGTLPLALDAVGYANGDDATDFAHRAARAMRALDSGDGVLILTDLYGATPSNVAHEIASHGTRTRRAAGLSLPMLLRVMNYAEQPLDELLLTAVAGARNGLILDDTRP